MSDNYWAYKVVRGKPRPLWDINAYKLNDEFDYFILPNGVIFKKDAEPLLADVFNRLNSNQKQTISTLNKLKQYVSKADIWGCNQLSLIIKEIEDNNFYYVLLLDLSAETVNYFKKNVRTKTVISSINKQSTMYNSEDYLAFHKNREDYLASIDCIVCNYESTEYKQLCMSTKNFYVLKESI